MNPGHEIFWLASRAVGIVAIALLGVSVALGLTMAARLPLRRGLAAELRQLHQACTLVTLALIVAHGGLLLFDSYLHPGIAGIAVPFALHYRTFFTGIGILAAWLATVLGLSFYIRRRLGTRTWRTMHRFTIVVYMLALGHVVGAGTDGRSPGMLVLLAALTAPVVFVFTYRVLPRRPIRRAVVAGT